MVANGGEGSVLVGLGFVLIGQCTQGGGGMRRKDVPSWEGQLDKASLFQFFHGQLPTAFADVFQGRCL